MMPAAHTKGPWKWYDMELNGDWDYGQRRANCLKGDDK